MHTRRQNSALITLLFGCACAQHSQPTENQERSIADVASGFGCEAFFSIDWRRCRDEHMALALGASLPLQSWWSDHLDVAWTPQRVMFMGRDFAFRDVGWGDYRGMWIFCWTDPAAYLKARGIYDTAAPSHQIDESRTTVDLLAVRLEPPARGPSTQWMAFGDKSRVAVLVTDETIVRGLTEKHLADFSRLKGHEHRQFLLAGHGAGSSTVTCAGYTREDPGKIVYEIRFRHRARARAQRLAEGLAGGDHAIITRRSGAYHVDVTGAPGLMPLWTFLGFRIFI